MRHDSIRSALALAAAIYGSAIGLIVGQMEWDMSSWGVRERITREYTGIEIADLARRHDLAGDRPVRGIGQPFAG